MHATAACTSSGATAFFNTNYAANLPVLDMLFGTYHDGQERWPENYGVVGKPLPHGFVSQQLYPFIAPPKEKPEAA